MIEIGTKFYYVPYESRWNKPRYIEVTKVGRLYFYADQRKFELDTLGEVVTYGFGGTLYETKQQHDDEVRASKLRFKLHDHLGYRGPKSIPLDKLEQVAQILGIADDKEA